MNDAVPITNPKPQRPSKGFWWALVILFVVMPTVIMLSASYRTSNSTATKTEVIIEVIRTGVDLGLVKHEQAPHYDFPSLLELCGESLALQELKALKAIDHERQCFVDGWRRPLIIGKDDRGRITIFSRGKDGLVGTSDDIH